MTQPFFTFYKKAKITFIIEVKKLYLYNIHVPKYMKYDTAFLFIIPYSIVKESSQSLYTCIKLKREEKNIMQTQCSSKTSLKWTPFHNNETLAKRCLVQRVPGLERFSCIICHTRGKINLLMLLA